MPSVYCAGSRERAALGFVVSIIGQQSGRPAGAEKGWPWNSSRAAMAGASCAETSAHQ
jgi:hypothetical protein